jgi:hypothetical protein
MAHRRTPHPPSEWRSWYQLQSWRKRRVYQLKIEPLCRRCRELGRTTPALVADHVTPHKGDWNAFVLGELQSLCAECHQRKLVDQTRGYRSDVGLDGYPLDPAHPAYEPRSRAPARGRERGPASPPLVPQGPGGGGSKKQSLKIGGGHAA